MQDGIKKDHCGRWPLCGERLVVNSRRIWRVSWSRNAVSRPMSTDRTRYCLWMVSFALFLKGWPGEWTAPCLSIPSVWSIGTKQSGLATDWSCPLNLLVRLAQPQLFAHWHGNRFQAFSLWTSRSWSPARDHFIQYFHWPHLGHTDGCIMCIMMEAVQSSQKLTVVKHYRRTGFGGKYVEPLLLIIVIQVCRPNSCSLDSLFIMIPVNSMADNQRHTSLKEASTRKMNQAPQIKRMLCEETTVTTCSSSRASRSSASKSKLSAPSM